MASFKLGKTPERGNAEWWEGTIPWITISDMADKRVIISTKECVTENALSNYFGDMVSKKGTLIMSFKLTVGRVSILGIDAVHNEAIISIYPYGDSNNIIRDYLKYIIGFMTRYCRKTDAVKGVTLNKEKLKNLLIPIPPLEEQKRIVDKLDEIFAELDKIDEKQIRLATIQEKMEAKILKLAIQGKLVEQRHEEGTGEDLFNLTQEEKQQLIEEGKIKKEKTLPAIEDIEIPFEIPSTWKWCKFGQLISLTSGVDLEPKDYFSESNCSSIPYITGASCIDEKGNLVINRFTDKSHVNSTIGDILLTCKGTIGKITVNDKGNMHLARQLMGIKTLIDFDFTRYYLMFIVDELKTKANGLIPGIDRPTVLNYYLPLPPLEEQKRISEKIEELLPLCRGN